MHQPSGHRNTLMSLSIPDHSTVEEPTPVASAAAGARTACRVRRALVAPVRMARRRPILVGSLLVLSLASVVFGVRQYALSEWRASEVALRADRFEDARRHLKVCLRVWPWRPEVHLRAARVARLMNDYPTAEAHLNRCLELQGGASDGVQVEFLLMRVQVGEIDEERGLGPITVLFSAVENGHPDSPAILETIARSFLLRLRYKPAFQCLNLWIEVDPQNPEPYYLRGFTFEQVNNPKAAKADYEKALELDPDMVPARLRVAEMFLHDKQAPEALPHLERLYRQAPADPRIQSRLGMCLFLQGRAEEARQLMESGLASLSDDPSLLIALANLDLQEGRGADAERRLRTVLKNDPSDTEALFVLASSLQLQGRTQEAAATLAEHEKKKVIVDRIHDLLRELGDSPVPRPNDYVEIGQFFFEIGKSQLGLYWLDRALTHDPQNQRAHRVLADHYDSKGQPAKAALHRKQIRSSEPSVPNPSSPSRGPGQ
jgi:tetratricopeptide (TPR) repeat protein